ncbi:N-acetylmuramoyl-L-alanine amidase domain-containing protein OS=Streptomyces antimycoticus OX=68175 GN=SANT12839_011920 PE=4 SV=1 [Streptomyces antimycoticus]
MPRPGPGRAPNRKRRLGPEPIEFRDRGIRTSPCRIPKEHIHGRPSRSPPTVCSRRFATRDWKSMSTATWRTHNRNSKGPWGPAERGRRSTTPSPRARTPPWSRATRDTPHCRDPLCHGVIDKAGAVHMVGHGLRQPRGAGRQRRAQSRRRRIRAAAGQRGGHRRQPSLLRLRVHQPRRWRGPVAGARRSLAIEKVSARPSAVTAGTGPAVGDRPSGVAAGQDRPAWLHDGLHTRPHRPAARRQAGRPRLQAPASYEPFPGADFFRSGRVSKIITAMGKQLVAQGGVARGGPAPRLDRCRTARPTRPAARTWRHRRTRRHPRQTSWDKLRVPNV